MRKLLLLTLTLSLATLGYSQGTVSGTIMDGIEPLIGVAVGVDGTLTGTVSDLDGKYSLTLPSGDYKLVFSYVGYSTQVQSISLTSGQNLTLDVNMAGGVLIDEVIVTGTRASNRTNLDSPVPVDIINVSELAMKTPQVGLNQLLHQTAPSFNSNTQTISDGTDHIDPASLRGLGPDQTLVLINGKRRHTTSLVNVNGTFGRGSVGTDLNTIPAMAIANLEILRDGAAAQYGTDAIAGVINIKLREEVNKLNLSLTTGANFTENIGPFGGETADRDGEVVNLGLNYGLPLGQDGGFVNFTGEFNFRGETSRMQEFSGQIFNAYNGVERLALADGADISSLNLAEIQGYGENLGYLSSDQQAALAGLTDITEIASVLDVDVTEQELAARGQERSDYNMLVGQSKLRGGTFFANMELPVADNADLYAFGGMGYRNGCSGCFYRLPSQNRTSTSIYPDGTVPFINSNITDKSIGIGLRGMINDWNADFSTVFGSNQFIFFIDRSHNATLGSSSPTAFNSGGHAFRQSTTNFDISQYFTPGGIAGINVAFGGEYRFENFEIIPGTELSWGNYDINGNLVNPATPDELSVTDYFGRARPSGAQCFAGFLPSNEVNANRSSAALYLDTEFDLSEAFLLGAAMRFENYSDFGSTFNYKATGRYKIGDNFALRAGYNTGFRAPSLHQINFSRTSTIFTLNDQGVSVPQEVGVFANTSRVAQILGIPELKEETSNSFSGGFTAKIPAANLRITVDGYRIAIDDRVILTGQFNPADAESPDRQAELQQLFDQAGATRAAFFANSISTVSQGVEVVLAHSVSFGAGRNLRNDLAATFAQTKWDQDKGINASETLEKAGLIGTYFDQTSRIYLEEAVPLTKITLGNTLTLDKLTLYLRNTYFGETTEATNAAVFNDDLEQTDNSINVYYSGKVITDLSLSYQFAKNLNVAIGANNLLDVYPDEADPTFQSAGRFIYSRRSPQFSFGGRHLFARVAFTLE